jgi:hypothetical protein
VTRFLHVANGTSTTATIHASGLPGRTSIWADVLFDGPVPGGIDDAALLDVRARHLAGEYGPTIDQAIAELTAWRAAIASGEPYDELVLWYEHDLFDQLNLIQLLAWVGSLPRFAPRVSLISINQFPGHPHFRGLGELEPAELASLFDTRRTVMPAQYSLAASAWDAFRAPDPRAIERLLLGDTSALPFLEAALWRHLQEFPWVGDGLSRSERRLLELVAPAPIDLRVVFPRMHEFEHAHYITDGVLMDTASALAAAPGALITVESPQPARLSGIASLTRHGESVLAGDIDRVRAWGLDRWLGGVHLEGTGQLWRWDDRQKALCIA